MFLCGYTAIPNSEGLGATCRFILAVGSFPLDKLPRFDYNPEWHNANVAQSVEQLFRKQPVAGSSPAIGSTRCALALQRPTLMQVIGVGLRLFIADYRIRGTMRFCIAKQEDNAVRCLVGKQHVWTGYAFAARGHTI